MIWSCFKMGEQYSCRLLQGLTCCCKVLQGKSCSDACSKVRSLKCPPVLNEKGTSMDTSSLYQVFFVGWEKTRVILVSVHFACLIVSVN